MTGRRPILARAGLALGGLVLALGAAEAAYRLATARSAEPAGDDDGFRARYRRMNETIYMRARVPGLVYEPRPGASVEMEYGPAGFNSAGMRDDREHELEPGPATRIAMVGDSLVWGEFLPLEASPPRQLELALGPERYEVLAFGVTGYDTADEALWYERAVRPHRPALVVVVYCLNDMLIMSGPYERFATPAEARVKEEQERELDRAAPVRRETMDERARRREAAASFRLLARALSLWERRRFEARYVDQYTLAAEDPARLARTGAALGRLGRAIRLDGARALLVLSPALESWDRYHWRPVHELVAAAGRQAGFAVLDPLEGWRASERPEALRVPGDNLHYNARGAALLGRTVAAAVESLR